MLRDMLKLGEKCAYVRSITDLDPAMTGLLAKYRSYSQTQAQNASTQSSLAYLNRLIADEEVIEIGTKTAVVDPKQPSGAGEEIIDQLTGRESEVLELIASGMSNRAIAGQLIVAETTLKWHVRNLYTILHVKSRTQAVAKARRLGLIS